MQADEVQVAAWADWTDWEGTARLGVEDQVITAPDEPVLLALGGSHYAPRATDIVRRRRAA